MRRTAHRLAFGMAMGSLVACASSCSTDSDTEDFDGASEWERFDATADASARDYAVGLDSSSDGTNSRADAVVEAPDVSDAGHALSNEGGPMLDGTEPDAVSDEKMFEGERASMQSSIPAVDTTVNEKSDAHADASADRDAGGPLPDDGGGPDRNDARDEHSAIDASSNDAAANDASTDDAGVGIAPPIFVFPPSGDGHWPAATRVVDRTRCDR